MSNKSTRISGIEAAAAPAAPVVAGKLPNPPTAEATVEAAKLAADKKAARKRSALAFHSAMKPDAEGKPTQKIETLESIKDFDSDKHAPMLRTHFKSEPMWCEWRAQWHESRAKDLRQEAIDLGKTGGKEVKRVENMQKKLTEQLAALAAAGVDIEGLKASLIKKLQEPKKS